jgi:hypothetical protein
VNVTSGAGTACARTLLDWTAGRMEHVKVNRPSVSAMGVALNSLVTDTVAGVWRPSPRRPSLQVRWEPGLVIPKLVPFGSPTVVGSHPPWRASRVQR